MLEGIEVVFIVIAIGAAGEMLLPASIGALAALALVILLGVVVHRPLASVPENTLKFAVGVLLSAFGTFWAGEGIGVVWPGGDTTILALIAGFLIMALLFVPLARARVERVAL
jgi:Ca2+/H+ antiporter, TMEM165/GDT1 family